MLLADHESGLVFASKVWGLLPHFHLPGHSSQLESNIQSVIQAQPYSRRTCIETPSLMTTEADRSRKKHHQAGIFPPISSAVGNRVAGWTESFWLKSSPVGVSNGSAVYHPSWFQQSAKPSQQQGIRRLCTSETQILILVGGYAKMSFSNMSCSWTVSRREFECGLFKYIVS